MNEHNIKMNNTNIKVAKQNAICHTPRLYFIGNEMQQMILCEVLSIYYFPKTSVLSVHW